MGLLNHIWAYEPFFGYHSLSPTLSRVTGEVESDLDPVDRCRTKDKYIYRKPIKIRKLLTVDIQNIIISNRQSSRIDIVDDVKRQPG